MPSLQGKVQGDGGANRGVSPADYAFNKNVPYFATNPPPLSERWQAMLSLDLPWILYLPDVLPLRLRTTISHGPMTTDSRNV